MFFVIILAMLVFVVLTGFETSDVRKTRCKLHNWEYMEDGYMKCKDCYYTPSTDKD